MITWFCFIRKGVFRELCFVSLLQCLNCLHLEVISVEYVIQSSNEGLCTGCPRKGIVCKLRLMSLELLVCTGQGNSETLLPVLCFAQSQSVALVICRSFRVIWVFSKADSSKVRKEMQSDNEECEQENLPVHHARSDKLVF